MLEKLISAICRQPGRQTPSEYARTLEKRRLEALLRQHGLGEKSARRITWQFFNGTKDTK